MRKKIFLLLFIVFSFSSIISAKVPELSKYIKTTNNQRRAICSLFGLDFFVSENDFLDMVNAEKTGTSPSGNIYRTTKVPEIGDNNYFDYYVFTINSAVGFLGDVDCVKVYKASDAKKCDNDIDEIIHQLNKIYPISAIELCRDIENGQWYYGWMHYPYDNSVSAFLDARLNKDGTEIELYLRFYSFLPLNLAIGKQFLNIFDIPTNEEDIHTNTFLSSDAFLEEDGINYSLLTLG